MLKHQILDTTEMTLVVPLSCSRGLASQVSEPAVETIPGAAVVGVAVTAGVVPSVAVGVASGTASGFSLTRGEVSMRLQRVAGAVVLVTTTAASLIFMVTVNDSAETSCVQKMANINDTVKCIQLEGADSKPN